MNERIDEFWVIFERFAKYDWTYEIKNLLTILDMCSPEDRVLYNCHPKTIDWKVFIQLNVYGYQKYVFKQDVSLPHLEST